MNTITSNKKDNFATLRIHTKIKLMIMETFKPAEGMTPEELMDAKMQILIKYDLLDVFEDDGTVGGESGWKDLNSMLEYYLEREEYRYCAVLKKRIKRYKKLWPCYILDIAND